MDGHYTSTDYITTVWPKAQNCKLCSAHASKLVIMLVVPLTEVEKSEYTSNSENWM